MTEIEIKRNELKAVMFQNMNAVAVREALIILEDLEDMLVKTCNLPPVSNLMPELEKIVSSRIKDAFDNGMQNYEKNELQAALDTIKRLVPPSYFEGICC